MAGNKPVTEQIRATIDLKVKAVLEEEALRMGLDLSLYVRIVLGEKAADLIKQREGKKPA